MITVKTKRMWVLATMLERQHRALYPEDPVKKWDWESPSNPFWALSVGGTDPFKIYFPSLR